MIPSPFVSEWGSSHSVARFWSLGLSEHPSVAILEATRFALMRHFLCSEELLPRQAFCHDVAVSGRQLGVPVTGYRRGEIEPHMGAYAVLGDALPFVVHDAKVGLRGRVAF